MLILGIETSCDETACAVVEDGVRVRSNVISSQIDIHARYGGVVPELASRAHIDRIIPVLEKALEDAAVALPDVDAFAVTLGPGLVGSLLVGVETAKALAYIHRVPLVPVHHLAGHLHTPFLNLSGVSSRVERVGGEGEERIETEPDSSQRAATDTFGYPYLGMVVSGGHSSIIRVDEPGRCEILGETVDDAPGEAYDKVAKALGLGYPGGPEVDRLAKEGDPDAVPLPRPMLKSGDFNVSFSGLKTAVVRYLADAGKGAVLSDDGLRADLCASFQAAVIDVLLAKLESALAATGIARAAITGGVACNSGLRERARRELRGIELVIPPPVFCTDNAAMVAGAAIYGKRLLPADFLSLNADVNYSLQGGEKE